MRAAHFIIGWMADRRSFPLSTYQSFFGIPTRHAHTARYAGTSCKPTPAPTLSSRTARGPGCGMPTGRSTWISQQALRSTL